jgi:isopentenyl phosphate kinase
VIVLGGGSYGHQVAYQYGYGEEDTAKSRLLDGIGPIRQKMNELATEVSQILDEKGTKTLVIPPFTHVIMKDGHISTYSTDIIRRSLDSKYTVLTHGDVCFDEVLGASILSGDTIIVHLAKQLGARRILIGTNVDGVFDKNPAEYPDAKHIPIINWANKDKVLSSAGPSSTTDVTGGMNRKIIELLEIAKTEIDIYIFNLTVIGRLKSLLQGQETVCTTVTA